MTVIIDGTTGIQSPDGSGTAPSYSNDGDGNTGVFFPAADTVAISTAGSERARVDSAGNMGLGVTPSAWSTAYKAFQLDGNAALSAFTTGIGQTNLSHNLYREASNWKFLGNDAASLYAQTSGIHYWYNTASGTAGGNATLIQAMTLDADGDLVVGGTSANVYGANRAITVNAPAAQNCIYEYTIDGTSTGYFGGSSTATWVASKTNIPLILYTNDTERARITSGGVFCVGTTSTDPRVDNVAGVAIGVATGIGIFSRTSGPAIDVNRKTDDGTLVNFAQDGTIEGTISVSGNTVSYNAFAGSHWSQLQDGSKPDILRGTVMESINELCEWPGEENERLPKAKISDTAGSKKVYGVFMAWDNDWTETNDMYVTAVGAFICRVNGAVTVQEGDLLESNGDGTARVQADDIIRSSTIGKVTSTVKTHEYDDGSYCVPTVLYCG